MIRSFVWLIVATFGLQSPALAEDKTAGQQAADTQQATDTMCVAEAREARAEADDQSYLVETAKSSATITRQGPETAIARLNPRFAARLASAIREARASGLPCAGIFSAYRPPAFGVGRFLDRFKSLHAYGLAVDMSGIGEPGSKDARLWYDIATRHGLFCPYGVDSRREWNHCQATPIKTVCPDNPLRNTITAEGPIDLAEMFKAGDAVVDNPPVETCVVMAANRPEHPQTITPHPARAAPAAPSAHVDRKHLHGPRNVAEHAVARRRWSDDELKRMVAADLRTGEPSAPKRPRRR